MRHAPWIKSASLPGLLAMLALTAGCPMTMGPPDSPGATTVALETVAQGFTSPLALASPSDGTGRLFVVDQVGRIWFVDFDGNRNVRPFLDLAAKIVTLNAAYDERGLLGLAFHPEYSSNGRFFVRYSAPRDGQPEESCNDPAGFIVGCHSEVLAEYRVSADDPDMADPDSERILLTIDKPQFNHNGGQIAFGPDGFLYVSFGDGGGANDNEEGHTAELGNGQDLTTLLGKILRIDVDSGDPYGIPADNPFVDDQEAQPEIWAFGLRNPWRFSFDTAGEHRLFLGDAGQNLFEEVNIIARGGNYGWNIREGLHCFDPLNPALPPDDCPMVDRGGDPLIDPIIEYPHVAEADQVAGIAVIGGFVYRGSEIPELMGRYVFGDNSTGFAMGDGTLFVASENDDGTWTLEELVITSGTGGRIGRFILGFGQDQMGEVYVLTTGNGGPTGESGEVDKIVSAP